MLRSTIKHLLKKKNTKLVKQLKATTYQPKIFENRISVDIKPVIIEHQKTSHVLPNTEKVGSNSSLYSDGKQVKIFQTKKM